MRLSRFQWSCLVGFLLFTGTAAAQQPQVSVTITPTVVSVGEPAELRVTVLVPTWFTSPPGFPSFELANAIVRLPPNSSYPTSKRIGGETWSGIVRNYQVYPLAGATYRIGDESIKMTYARPGYEPVVANVAVPTIELRAEVPEGARELEHYIAGNSLTLTREVEGDVAALTAGDAVVLRYTAELDGLPAMFLPPLFEEQQIPGVSIYIDEPVVSDDGTAKRSEKVTLVFEAGGTFLIPSASLDWWDSKNKVVKTARVDALALTVDGPPLPPVEAEAEAIDRSVLVRLAALVAVVIILAASFIPRILRSLRASGRRRRDSEEFAFKRLRIAFRSGDARNVHHELVRWLGRANPDSNLRQFATHYGNDELSKQLEVLNRSLFEGGDEQVDLRQLEKLIGLARRKFRRSAVASERYALPPLNP